MIRRARPQLGDRERSRLAVYQKRVDDRAGDLDRQWPLFLQSQAGKNVQVALKGMSHSYCFYCDYDTGYQIDHFVPTSLETARAFAWENLNWSCGICNTLYKRGQWSPELLDPTGPVETADYFVVDHLSGQLEPNLLRSSEEQVRALYTREILGLNRDELADRRRQYVGDFLTDLQTYQRNPCEENDQRLLRYLRPDEPFRMEIRQCIRSRDPQWQGLVQIWLEQSEGAGETLTGYGWLTLI